MAFTPAFQENPSRLPNYADFGSGLKENELEVVEIPPQMPKAEEYNQMGGTLEGLGVVAFKAVLSLTHTTGTYSKVAFSCINTTALMGASLATGDIVVTKNGTGDLTFQFGVGKIPPLLFAPLVAFNHATASTRTYESVLVDTRTVRVRMFNSGSAAEALCTVWFM